MAWSCLRCLNTFSCMRTSIPKILQYILVCKYTLVMRPLSTSAGSVSRKAEPPPHRKKKKKTFSKCALCNLCPSIKQFGCWQFEQTAPRSVHLWHHEKCPVVCGMKKSNKKNTNVWFRSLFWVEGYRFKLRWTIKWGVVSFQTGYVRVKTARRERAYLYLFFLPKCWGSNSFTALWPEPPSVKKKKIIKYIYPPKF